MEKNKLKHRIRAVFLILAIINSSPMISAQETDYHGFKCLDFKFEGHVAKIEFPQTKGGIGKNPKSTGTACRIHQFAVN